MNDGWGISCEIAHRWMPQDLADDKSTLVQIMAWCHQATSHYLSQCWPRSMSPNGVIRPQLVNKITHDDAIKWKYFPRYWPFVRGIHRGRTQRPVTRSFGVSCDLRRNKRLNKQLWGWWFETLLRPVWRQCNVMRKTEQQIIWTHGNWLFQVMWFLACWSIL